MVIKMFKLTVEKSNLINMNEILDTNGQTL